MKRDGATGLTGRNELTIRRWAGGWIFRVMLFGSVLCGGGAGWADENQLPNIVMILADDLGYGDVGCYNGASKIPTPNLDRLARDGMMFTDAHSPCTVCTPSRYGLLTGQMAFRIPRGGKVFTGAGGPSLIAPDRLTLPEMLRSAGYRTACVGKWHVGLSFYDSDGNVINEDGLKAVQRIDYSRPVKGGPLDCGFDEFFGTACCPTTDWLYAFIDDDQIPVPPVKRLDKGGLPSHPYSRDNRAGMVAPDFDLEEVDMKFLAKSQEFMTRHVNNRPGEPFFLFHSTQAVHLPSFAGKQFKGKTNSGPHGDFIFELDFIVGQLLDTIRELGIEDNTIIIFSSDNGPEVPTVFQMRNDHRHDGARPWRGMKRDNWEGGHRVPFLVRWPGVVKAGSKSDQLLSLTDVMATLAAVVGAELPESAAEDSFDLSSVWKGEAKGRVRDHLLIQGFGGKRWLAIRSGRWKYLAHRGSGGNRYDKHRQLAKFQLPEKAPNAPAQLYDLETDEGETTNLFFERPKEAARMKRILEESIQSGRSAPSRS